MNDAEYWLGQLGLQLTQHGSKWNCRCPLCGDGEKASSHRGWFLTGDDHITYRCWNCGASMSFTEFLDPHHYDLPDVLEEYTRNRKMGYLSAREENPIEKKKERIRLDNIIYKKLSKKVFKPIKLFPKHLHYMMNRKVPREIIDGCFVYTGNKWYKDYVVIPFYNGKRIYGFQARSITKKMFNISNPNSLTILNYFNVDNDRPVYILEGAFDHWMVRNSIAVLGASKGEDYVKLIKNRVYIYDCDERGYQDTLKRVNEGEKVCLLWDHIAEYKDINNYVCETGDNDIMTLIINSVYSGLDAQMRLLRIKMKYGYSNTAKIDRVSTRKNQIKKLIERGNHGKK